MGSRAIISFLNGRADAELYLDSVRQEPAIGEPKACPGCPLRRGGEWECGALSAVASMNEAERAEMEMWGCHAGNRPCAGMRRLLGSEASKFRHIWPDGESP